MLKNRLKKLNQGSPQGKSIEIINVNDLSSIKGGKVPECPKLETCQSHCGDCPSLAACGTNHTSC